MEAGRETRSINSRSRQISNLRSGVGEEDGCMEAGGSRLSQTVWRRGERVANVGNTLRIKRSLREREEDRACGSSVVRSLLHTGSLAVPEAAAPRARRSCARKALTGVRNQRWLCDRPPLCERAAQSNLNRRVFSTWWVWRPSHRRRDRAPRGLGTFRHIKLLFQFQCRVNIESFTFAFPFLCMIHRTSSTPKV